MKVFFLLIAWLTTSSAYAASDPQYSYDRSETLCPYHGEDERIREISAGLDYADQSLPNIPPEEAQYLAAESSAIRGAYRVERRSKKPSYDQINQRSHNLRNRPLYHAWVVRQDLVRAQKAVITIIASQPKFGATYPNKPEVENLDRTLAAMPVVNWYQQSMQEFLTRLEFTKSGIVSDNQRLQIYDNLLLMTSALQDYARCKLARIMGKQTVILR